MFTIPNHCGGVLQPYRSGLARHLLGYGVSVSCVVPTAYETIDPRNLQGKGGFEYKLLVMKDYVQIFVAFIEG